MIDEKKYYLGDSEAKHRQRTLESLQEKLDAVRPEYEDDEAAFEYMATLEDAIERLKKGEDIDKVMDDI